MMAKKKTTSKKVKPHTLGDQRTAARVVARLSEMVTDIHPMMQRRGVYYMMNDALVASVNMIIAARNDAPWNPVQFIEDYCQLEHAERLANQFRTDFQLHKWKGDPRSQLGHEAGRSAMDVGTRFIAGIIIITNQAYPDGSHQPPDSLVIKPKPDRLLAEWMTRARTFIRSWVFDRTYWPDLAVKRDAATILNCIDDEAAEAFGEKKRPSISPPDDLVTLDEWAMRVNRSPRTVEKWPLPEPMIPGGHGAAAKYRAGEMPTGPKKNHTH